MLSPFHVDLDGADKRKPRRRRAMLTRLAGVSADSSTSKSTSRSTSTEVNERITQPSPPDARPESASDSVAESVRPASGRSSRRERSEIEPLGGATTRLRGYGPGREPEKTRRRAPPRREPVRLHDRARAGPD